MKYLNYFLLAFVFIYSCSGKNPTKTVLKKKIDLTKEPWYNKDTKDTVDQYGCHYIAGTYSSDTLIIQKKVLLNPNQEEGTSIYVAKFDSTGNLIWAQTAGGDSYDGVMDVTFNLRGELIITGDFRSNRFIIGNYKLMNFSQNRNTDGDMYVALFDADGNLSWVNTGGGLRTDIGWKLSINEGNQVIVEGTSISDTIYFTNTETTNKRSLIRNKDSYESLNFRVVYNDVGALRSLVEKDADYKKLKREFENYFSLCLNKYKIKITCSGGCYGVAYSVTCKIGVDGDTNEFKIERSKFCDDKVKDKFENDLLEFLKTRNYFNELRGKTFELNVNRILKC